MRTGFLRDFTKLHNLLFEDPEYYDRSGYLAVNEIQGGEHASLSLMYSVYLVLDFDGPVTIERYKAYVNDMHLYQHYAFTSQYHLIKAAELRFKKDIHFLLILLMEFKGIQKKGYLISSFRCMRLL